MRKILFILCVFLSCSLFAQTENAMKHSFSKEKVAEISNYFKSSIDLKLPDVKGIYNQQQAKLVVQNFFDKHPVSSFSIKHQGGSEDKALFQIGSLKCGKVNFRTYILYDMVEGKPQIIELRIESEE